jgi:hypothetical protein
MVAWDPQDDGDGNGQSIPCDLRQDACFGGRDWRADASQMVSYRQAVVVVVCNFRLNWVSATVTEGKIY